MTSSSPFPGMDPYLEDKRIWPGFHHSLAEQIVGLLNGQIGPKYYADVEVHTVLEDIHIGTTQTIYPDVGLLEPEPDVPMPSPLGGGVVLSPAPIERTVPKTRTKTRTVRVQVTETDQLVTAIEILSPANKRGEGLSTYRQKRAKLLRTAVHLVELDLLRGGQRPGPELTEPPLEALAEAEYVLLVNREREAFLRKSEIWPVALNEKLPNLPIPLLEPDPVVPLDLNAAIASVYQRAGYSWRIDYGQAVPPPKLRQKMQDWVGEVIDPNKNLSGV